MKQQHYYAHNQKERSNTNKEKKDATPRDR
jgi:hypothetical protein